ncbi:MAG: CopD family protein [Clostridia bacterium]|nr:CopD family protein [Clostridia bacterium]
MEKIFEGLSTILHVLAAVTWIGSIIYSQFGVTPALKPLGPTKSHAVNGLATKNFSGLTWASLVVLLATGIYAVTGMWDKLDPVLTKPAGITLLIKLTLVSIMIIILFFQFYQYGPRMKQLTSPTTPKNQENTLQMTRLARVTQKLSKTHLYTGLAIIVAAVILAQLLEQ